MRRRLLRSAFVMLGFTALAASRRWREFTCPQVWCEDWVVIRDFAAHGWGSVALPLNGYLVLVPRLLTGSALALSLAWYPLLSALLATLFSGLVGVAVALAPTQLRARYVCAAALFIVPGDPEVFDLPLYALWWAPVLLFLVVLWRRDNSWLGLRLVFVALGGLSSPLVLVAVPPLLGRAVWRPRRRADGIIAAAALAAAGWQLHCLAQGHNASRPPLSSLGRDVIPKFFGWYVAGGWGPPRALLWPLGGLVLGLVAAALGRRRRWGLWALAFLWLASLGAVVLRVDPQVLDPVAAGPRYFFTTYFLTSWLLLQLAAAPGAPGARRWAGVVLAAAAVNALPAWSRSHADLDWRNEVRSAPYFASYALPVEFDGSWERAWSLDLPRSAWLALRARGGADAAGPTYPYRVLGPRALPAPGPLPGGGVAVTFAPGTAGPAGLHLSPQGRILFRSGSNPVAIPLAVVGQEGEFVPRLPRAPDWVVLEFSSAALRPGFVLRVGWAGGPAGEWRAVP